MSDAFNNERFRSTEGQEGVDLRNAISYTEHSEGAAHRGFIGGIAGLYTNIFIVPALIGICLIVAGMFIKRQLLYFLIGGLGLIALIVINKFIIKKISIKLLRIPIMAVSVIIYLLSFTVIPALYYAKFPDPVYVTSERTIKEAVVFSRTGKELATVAARERVNMESVTRDRKYFFVTTKDGISGMMLTNAFLDDVIPSTSLINEGKSSGADLRQQIEIIENLPAGRPIRVIKSISIVDNNVTRANTLKTLKEGDTFTIAGRPTTNTWDHINFVPVQSGDVSGWAWGSLVMSQLTPEMKETALAIADERSMIGRRAIVNVDRAYIRNGAYYERAVVKGDTVIIIAEPTEEQRGKYFVRCHKDDYTYEGYIDVADIRILGENEVITPITRPDSPTVTHPKPKATTKFKIGDTFLTKGNGFELYEKAEEGSPVLKQIPDGVVLTVTGNPVRYNFKLFTNYYFLPVEYEGVKGWVDSYNFLIVY